MIILPKFTSVSFLARLYSTRMRGSATGPLVPGPLFSVVAARPNLLVIRDVTTSDLFSPGSDRMGLPYNLLISNGDVLVEASAFLRKATYALTADELANIQSPHGLAQAIHADLIFAEQPLQYGLRASSDKDQDGDNLTYEKQLPPALAARQRIVVSAKSKLPLVITSYTIGAEGQELEFDRVEYDQWKLDIPPSSDVFRIELPQDFTTDHIP